MGPDIPAPPDPNKAFKVRFFIPLNNSTESVSQVQGTRGPSAITKLQFPRSLTIIHIDRASIRVVEDHRFSAHYMNFNLIRIVKISFGSE